MYKKKGWFMSDKTSLKTILAFSAAILISGVSGFMFSKYLGNENGQENPFLSESKNEKNDSQNYFRLYDKKFTKALLPRELAIADYNLENQHFIEMKEYIKSYAVRYKSLKDNNNFNLNNLPDISSFYTDLVTQTDVLNYMQERKIYENNEQGQFQATIDLKTIKITEGIARDISLLKAQKNFDFYLTPPRLPPYFFDFSEFPSIGDKLAPMKIVMVGSYFCPRCSYVNSLIPELFKKYGDKMQFNFVPHTVNFTDISNYFMEAGYCVQKQGDQKYWQYHRQVFDNQDLLKIKIDDFKTSWNVISKITSNIKDFNHDDFTKCMNNKNDLKNEIANKLENINQIRMTTYPAIFLNGRQLSQTNNLVDMIEEAMNARW